MKNKIKISSNKITVPSSTEYLLNIREFVREFGASNNISSKIISQISLAVDEACTNIIKHSYKNSPDKELSLTIKLVNNEIRIKIVDNGIHFNPNLIREPNIAESQKKKKGGGLGIYLMKKLMDDVQYSVRNDSNELLLTKKIGK